MNATMKQVKSAFAVLAAVGEAIKDLSPVPSGILYAHLSGLMDLATFTRIIDHLKNVGLVREDNAHRLHWIDSEPSDADPGL